MALPVPLRPDSAILTARREYLDDLAHELVRSSLSTGTRSAYDRDWDAFVKWCANNGEVAMPASPDTLTRYIAHLVDTGHRPSTITRYVSSVSVCHKLMNVPNPAAHEVVRKELKGVRNRLGATVRQKSPLTTTLLAGIVAAMDLENNLTDRRDRAMLLLCYAGALRRSEVVRLDIGDVVAGEDGLELMIAKSKTDQAAVGTLVGIVFGHSPATCPIKAWQDWRVTLAAAGHTSGPAFRDVTPRGTIVERRLSDRTVANVIKRRAAAAGLDPAMFGGHSGRRGFATTAIKLGADRQKTKRHGRWDSDSSFERYVDAGNLFENNASAHLGL